ncbi:EAL domain-containing protein [Bordetella pertussis]|uniref:EAL domain-containing protein n=1 Tax=Bordetella pertussis TaxID=520 RepID=UPI00366E63EF
MISSSAADLHADAGLAAILQGGLLNPCYQPVADLAQDRIFGHESLIRGPHQSVLHMPDALFAAARRDGLHAEIELASLQAGARRFIELDSPGNLFLNLSGAVLVACWRHYGSGLPVMLLADSGLAADRVVIEITEYDPVGGDLPALNQALACLRASGMRVALDDYGVGNASLQLWAELAPDLVKIDRYFFNGISRDERRLQLVRSMVSTARQLNSTLVAEGIENADDLRTVYELGTRYAQGWFLGRPENEPRTDLPTAARASLQPACATQPTRIPGHTALALRVEAPPVMLARHTNDDVQRLFQEHRHLHAVAVLDTDSRPVGIINRRDFSEHYAQRYTRDLFGRNPCSTFMNPDPVLVDVHTSIDQLSHVLLSDDQRYLADGFVITRGGRYDSLGTGEALVRSVTEMRLEAARYANPLTSLPGNIPISQHIAHLLDHALDFVVCYADLDNFKPFNDVYGYWRGDDMIRLCADSIKRHCDARRDFVGHVGGDDFVVMLRSTDWRLRIERIIAEFNLRALDLYDDQGRHDGGIRAEDRYGVLRFFPCVTLGIGALEVSPVELGSHVRPENLASAAARVKQQVKHGNLALLVQRYQLPARAA